MLLFFSSFRNAVHWDQCDAPGFFPWFIKVFARLSGGIPPNHDFEKGIVLQRKIIMDYFGKYLQQKSIYHVIQIYLYF